MKYKSKTGSVRSKEDWLTWAYRIWREDGQKSEEVPADIWERCVKVLGLKEVQDEH